MSTGIEWTDETWNPMTGCTEISAGCDHCYARVVAETRLRDRYLAQAPVVASDTNRADPFAPRVWLDRLDEPRHWRTPRRVFVNSMSDVFHAHFSVEQIAAVITVIAATPRHQFQLLTKRPERARRLVDAGVLTSPPNLWLGVTVEDRRATRRIDELRQIPATVRFLSCEPLLEDLGTIDLTGIHWMILGGESGLGCRPCHPTWLQAAIAQCEAQGTAVFVKQLGGFPDPRSKTKAFVNGQLYKAFPMPRVGGRAA